MANIQIKSEKLTPFGGIFRSWINLMLFRLKPQLQPWGKDAHGMDISIARSYAH